MHDQQERQFVLLLALLELRGRASKSTVLDYVAQEQFWALEQETKGLYSNGEEIWRNLFAWTRQNLVEAGFLSGTTHGQWALKVEGALHFRRLFDLMKSAPALRFVTDRAMLAGERWARLIDQAPRAA